MIGKGRPQDDDNGRLVLRQQTQPSMDQLSLKSQSTYRGHRSGS